MSVQTPWGGVLTSQDAVFDPIYARQQATARRYAQGLQGLGQEPSGVAQAAQLASVAAGAALGNVAKVSVRTQITPDLDYTPEVPFAPEPPGLSTWFVRRVVKPEIAIVTPAGTTSFAPYGRPSVNLFPLLAVLAGTGAYFTGRWVWRGLTK